MMLPAKNYFTIQEQELIVKMKIAILMLPMIMLSSCASIPDTPDDLVSNTEIKNTQCYSQEHEAVSTKVRDFLERCYRTETVYLPVMGIPMPSTTKYQVVEESKDNSTRLSVRSEYGFGISVVIKPNTNNCRTEVNMYALRSHLREKFDRIDDAVNDKNPECGII